jgi:imidazolonepropionase-like amidohydrolase
MRTRLLLAALAALISGVMASASPALAQQRPRPTPSPAPPPIALIGGTIIDGAGGAPVADGVILLRGDRIEAVGPRASVRIPANAQRIDVAGKWLTPGLIDAHIHFFQSGGLYTRPDVVDLRSTYAYELDLEATKDRIDDTLARYLASGITSVVDAGGPLWNFEVRDHAAASNVSPRVAVAGPLIATEPTPQQQTMNLGDPPIISATSPEDAARLARDLLPRRPAFIKIWGIGDGPAGAERLRAITRAVAAVAHPANIRVAVHATTLDMARAALEAGADILVHSVEDRPVDPAFIDLVKRNNVVYITTLMAYEGYADAFRGRPDLSPIERRLGAADIIATLSEGPAFLRAAASQLPDPTRVTLPNLRAMTAAGARVAAGTDAGNIGALHGPALHRELALMVQAGLTPSQVITAATRDAAFAASPTPDVGLIKVGYRADVLVLDANPLTDIANLGRLSQVWSRGAPHDPRTLVPPSPEAVVQLQLDLYNAHDIDGFVATYSPDIEIYDLPNGATPNLQGHAALRERYARVFEGAANLRCEINLRTVERDYVVDQEICRLGPTGEVFRGTAVYQVENGLIRRVWFTPN